MSAPVTSKYVFHNHELFVDRRNSVEKSFDFALSLVKELHYAVTMVKEQFFDSQKTCYETCEKKKEWTKESQGCVVFLTGLNGHPSIWKKHLEHLKGVNEIDRFVPYVPENGECELDQAAEPIYKVVLDYTHKHPGKKLCLIGVSNGARIATYIETKLRQSAPDSPVKVSTIAGAHFGSRWANYLQILNALQIAHCCPTLFNELGFASDKAKELLDEVQKPLAPNVKRSYQFYATTEDLIISDLASSIPKIGAIANGSKIYHGEGHNSIVEHVADEQMKDALQFLRE